MWVLIQLNMSTIPSHSKSVELEHSQIKTKIHQSVGYKKYIFALETIIALEQKGK